MPDIATAARCGYWGYKVFQAARLCSGDVTVVAELFAEGCAEVAAEEVIFVAVEAAQNAKDLGSFTKMLSTELATVDSGAGVAERMGHVNKLYETFVEADTNGDGHISREEFIRFASKLGESRKAASATFKRLDKDGNGHLSFQEWVEGSIEPGERAKNCPGLHGLNAFTTPSSYGCDACGRSIPKGTRAYGCRTCNYDVHTKCLVDTDDDSDEFEENLVDDIITVADQDDESCIVS